MLDQLVRKPVLALVIAATLLAVGGVGGGALAHSSDRAKPFHVAAVAFSFVPSAPHTGQSIVFSATATDARDPAASYTWQWGDGDPAAERVQRHEYRAAGRYKVVLTVRDAQGRMIGKIARWVTIRGSGKKVKQQTTKQQTTVALRCRAGRLQLGEAVNMSGSITPARSGVPVKVIFRGPSGESTTVESMSENAGLYKTGFQPKQEGSWNVQSSQAESSEYEASTSERCTFTVTKPKHEPPANTRTTVSCPSNPMVGEPMNVSGVVVPARAGVEVRVVFLSPSHEETPFSPTSSAEGTYNTSFTPKEPGTWTVESSQAESREYQASSATCTFTSSSSSTSASEELH
ncbi:MAG: PKD domain-containing protein [Solirubrobacteraceae bacterium]